MEMNSRVVIDKPLILKEGVINNKSPLRYPGGKTRACNKLNVILKENFDLSQYSTIVSPFFGGGSFEFYLQNNYNKTIIANDLFDPLYTFWKVCKENNKELVYRLEKVLEQGVTKEVFAEYRKQIINCEDETLKSVQYFTINRCSFSGATLSGGFSEESSTKRFNKASIERVKSLDLRRITFYNLDYETFLSQLPNKDDVLIWLDPPYYLEKGSKLYGSKGDLHTNFDHMRLFNVIKTYPNWIMTYNNCEFIKNIYKDYLIIETDWKYGMNKTKESSEIVIIRHEL